MFLKSNILFREAGGEFLKNGRFIIFFLCGDGIKQFYVEPLGSTLTRRKIPFKKKFFAAVQCFYETPDKIRRCFQTMIFKLIIQNNLQTIVQILEIHIYLLVVDKHDIIKKN